MAAIARGQVNGCNLPLIWFGSQVRGILTDVVSLSFRVMDLTVTPAVQVVAPTVVNLAACPGGNRLGLGRYVAPFSAATLNRGTHQIEWTYQIVATAAAQTIARRFEVLDEAEFVTGAGVAIYGESRNLVTAIPGTTVAQAQRALARAADEIAAHTGRYFEPRYLVHDMVANSPRRILFGVPVMALELVTVLSPTATGIGASDLDLDLLRVFNRHLGGLLDPDDRAYSRIEVVEEATDTAIFGAAVFIHGTQNIRVTGVYGYTDPDGSPLGYTPVLIERAAQLMAADALQDPTGLADTSSARISSARTRDQSVTFRTPAEVGAPSYTGDPAVDSILARFARPPKFVGA